MFHKRKFHKTKLRLYDHHVSFFKEQLTKDNSFSNYHLNKI